MRRILQILSIGIILSLMISSCSKKPANYYRKAEIDGKYAIVGKYPVANNIANKINCYHFIYNDTGKLIKVEYLKSGKLHRDSFFGVARIIIEYSEGYEKRIYQDENGKPTANFEDNIYSIRLKLDKNNYPVALFNYDIEGKLAEDKNGVAQLLWTIDNNGQRIKSIRINVKGDRIKDSYGIYGIYESRFEYDKKGKQILNSFHGKDGQLLENKLGFAILRNKYDEQGNVIEQKYFGTDEQLKDHEYFGVAIIRWKYDEQGNMIEEKYFGTDEQLKDHEYFGVAIIRNKYDEQGNVVEEKYFGTDEQLKDSKHLGVAIIRWKYDEQGNVVEHGLNKDEKVVY